MKPIATSKLQTTNIIILLFSTLTLALGVALCANYLTNIIGLTYTLLLTSLVLILLSLIIIIKTINPQVVSTLRIRGGFHFNVNELKGKEILGYNFNDDIAQYLKAIAIENKAYHNALLKKDQKFSGRYDPDVLNFYNLASSCTEFLFLDRLSLHLNSYFIENNIDSSLIESIPRSKLSQNILKNRILELITRNFQEREAFVDHEINDTSRLCFAVGAKGEVYNSVDLEFPKDTKIIRLDNNDLKIENDVFEVICKIRCDGFNTVIPSELIIGQYDALTLVVIELKTTIKKHFFLSQNDLILHEWLDSFLIEFEEYISINKLEEKSYLQLVNVLKAQLSTTR